MSMQIKVFKSLVFILLSATASFNSGLAQIDGTAVGQWSSIYSYNEITDIVENGGVFYVGTQSGFYTYDRNTGEIEGYSKTSGMANPGVGKLAYDELTGTTIIAYQNSNIDLFKDQGFFNIPSLYLSQASGNKEINAITTFNGIAYLSSGKGLIAVDLKKKEIKETVVFYDNGIELVVNSAIILNGEIYVATTAGVYKTNLNNPSIIYYGTWQKISDLNFGQMVVIDDKIHAVNGKNVYLFTETMGFQTIYTHDKNIAKFYKVNTNKIGISGYDDLPNEPTNAVILNANGTVDKTFDNRKIVQYFELGGGINYYGEYKKGLFKDEPNTTINYIPNSIQDYRSFDVYAYNGNLVIAHGGHKENLNPLKNTSTYTLYKNNRFESLNWVSNDYNFIDFIRVVKSEKSGKLFAAAYGGGVSEMTFDYGLTDHKEHLEPRKGELPPKIYVYGLALDKEDNLWIVNSGTDKLLKIKTPDNQWYTSREIVNPLTANMSLAEQSLVGDIIIDQNGFKWLIPLNSGGIIVYDDKGTIENNSDDQYTVLQHGVGRGNLPSNRVLCAAADLNNNIWVGTDNGIGIIYCMNDLDDPCDAEIPVIQNDEHPGYFFQNVFVSAIAVDGGNRKWIGTNVGLWLVSEDGRETIHQFTTSNSPLPSNNIKRINIDPITGEVYISTDQGLVRYRGTATQGRLEMEKPLEIYPNPVPANFSGLIAINGLAEQSDVRIVDMSGQLVYRTTANGGQAVWNGHDYLGKKAQSGVYLVLVRGKDGIEKGSGKIIFRE